MSFFESLANSIEETIIVVDRGSKVLFINRRGEEILGIHSEGVRGRKLASVFSRNTDFLPFVRKAIEEVRPFSGENAVVNLRGAMRFDFTVSPLIEKDRVGGAVILLRESHDLPGRMDEQFDSVMVLLSSVAHEIKNPLAGIRGSAQLMKRQAKGEQSKYLDVIIRETERLDRVVKSYLFAARKPLLNRLNVHEVIEEALNIMGPEMQLGKITLRRAYDPSLPEIMGDEAKLLQVMINVLKNAVEAIEGAGTIEITTKPAYEYMVEKRRRVKRRYAVVTVSDTGTGIAEGDVEKVLMPFFTRKREGSGLGLAISNKIIRDHGGLMKLRSAPERGTSVDIYLPFAG